MKKEVSKKIIKYIIIGLIIIFTIILIKKIPIFLDLFGVIVISFIISYSLRPYYKFLVRKGVSKKVSALLVLLSIVVFIILILTILIPCILSEGKNLAEILSNLEGYLGSAKNIDIPFGDNEYVIKGLNNVYYKLQEIVSQGIGNLGEKIISIGENILIFLISPTMIYFFLCDDELILNGIAKFIPNGGKREFRKAIIHVDKVLERYIITQFELCGIIGILTFISLMILRVKFPLLLSFINAIFNIIPYFGPFIGAVPIVILASIKSIKSGIYVAIVLTIIQQIEGDVIGPKIIGDNINAHPLTVLMLLLIGGNIGGVLGMIIIIPIWVTAKVLYEDLEGYLY